MASVPCLTYHDGKLEVPEELRDELRLQEGVRLHVVYAADQILLERREQVDSVSAPIDWHTLRGALADLDVDLNAELSRDRVRELELDAR